jgi:hypothetical protein
MGKAPIVVLGFNRPSHLKSTLQALAASNGFDQSQVFIFLDGPRYEEEKAKCAQVVEVAMKFCTMHRNTNFFVRKENLGLFENITSAVNEVMRTFDNVIVVEDDILVSDSFIQFMNQALEFFCDKKNIWHVSGWTPDLGLSDEQDIYFAQKMFCWGWATWKDRWCHFTKDTKTIVAEWSVDQIGRFTYDCTANHWNQVLFNHAGVTNTWAIFWQAVIFERDGLCVNPRSSLTRNIGFDGSGVHYVNSAQRQITQVLTAESFHMHKADIEESEFVRSQLKAFLRGGKSRAEVKVTQVLVKLNLYTRFALFSIANVRLRRIVLALFR